MTQTLNAYAAERQLQVQGTNDDEQHGTGLGDIQEVDYRRRGSKIDAA